MKPTAFNSVTTEEEARDLAIEWQHWQAEQALSWNELMEWQYGFIKLGRQYNLTDEYIENGVL